MKASTFTLLPYGFLDAQGDLAGLVNEAKLHQTGEDLSCTHHRLLESPPQSFSWPLPSPHPTTSSASSLFLGVPFLCKNIFIKLWLSFPSLRMDKIDLVQVESLGSRCSCGVWEQDACEGSMPGKEKGRRQVSR